MRHDGALRVLSYIKDLTKEGGDADFGPYIERLRLSPEEVLLIKFADIHSNADNSLKELEAFTHEWLTGFWLPLLERYEKELLARQFMRFADTANFMVADLRRRIEAIKTAVEGRSG